MLNDTYRLLASVTVVRELYDADKGVYDVLQEFLNEIIVRKRLYSFTSSELTQYLNSDYSFQLSESIVKTCLRRMKLSKVNGEYKCTDIDKRENNIDLQIGESEANNNMLFSQLYSFLEKRLDHPVLEDEKGVIKRMFCDFLLQDSFGNSSTYIQYFHEFVLSVEEDTSMMEILRNVKEGTLIYEGIRYSSNINETGSWNSKLHLVLDTEILFAIGGYNSSLYQAMYLELEKYLKEINKGSSLNGPKVKLCFFGETKKEIDYYFESAERIVRRLDDLDPTKEAMGQIVNDCETASDVQTKKALFYEKLRAHNISIIEHDFYDTEKKDNIEYNLEDNLLHEKYSNLWNEKKENICRSLVCLSHINILRKGVSNNGFEKCGYIFLTATGRTLKLSGVPELLKDGEVPLATTFDFLINRFWFKLNKGFGINRTPRTMDMVMRARHILASIINSKVSEKYDEFKYKYEKSSITKEEFCALNCTLRNQLKMPDEVDKDTIGEVIDDLDRWDMEEIIEQQKKNDFELKNARNKISRLTEELDESTKTQDGLQHELTVVQEKYKNEKYQHDTEVAQLNKNIELLKKQLLDEQKNREAKEKSDAVRKYNLICIITIVLTVLGIIGFVYGTIKGLLWATAISAIIEISAIVSIVISYLKKKKPKDI